MWDLNTIIQINKIASELSAEGKSPSGAIHELSMRRSKARKEYEAAQAEKAEKSVDSTTETSKVDTDKE